DPVLESWSVAQVCVASPQAGGRQVNVPALGVGVGVGAGVAVGVGVGVTVGFGVAVGVGEAVGIGVGVGVGLGPAPTTTLCSTVAWRPSPSVIVRRAYLVPTSWKVKLIVTPPPRIDPS